MKWSKFLGGTDKGEYRPGDWLVIDDISGFRGYASEMVKSWDGYMTKYPLERNPQDFLRTNPEKGIPWARTEQEDTFGQSGPEDL